jgi:hypothetical protein
MMTARIIINQAGSQLENRAVAYKLRKKISAN